MSFPLLLLLQFAKPALSRLGLLMRNSEMLGLQHLVGGQHGGRALEFRKRKESRELSDRDNLNRHALYEFALNVSALANPIQIDEKAGYGGRDGSDGYAN
jgi:hypothetical protein